MLPNFFTRFVFAGFLIVAIQNYTFAQADTVSAKTDSLNGQILSEYRQRYEQVEKQRIEDSIRKDQLELQIRLLQNTDDQKRQALQKQLSELNARDSVRLAQKKARIDSIRVNATGQPVTGFFEDTLFFIYSKLGSFSATERAQAITARIDKLGEILQYKPDSLQVVQSEATVDIVYGDRTIMSVSENDALWNNTSTNQLADRYRQVINQAVIHYREETGFKTLLVETGVAVLVLVVIGLIIYFISKLFSWSHRKISRQKGRLIRGIKIKNYTLFNESQQVSAFHSLNNILKWVFILLAIYIALPILFGIFPWTQNFAEDLFGYILKPIKKIANAIWNYLPNLVTILVIIFVFRYVLKAINFLKKEIQAGNLQINGFYRDWANPTYQIIRILIFAFMIVVIFPYLPGSDSPIFKGVSVFLGFLFTFGSAGSLSNIIAGLVLTYMRLFKIGDRVKVGDVVGDVIEKSMLVTRIRTIKNEIISIPNSTVMSSHTINYSSEALEKGLIVHTTITIGYDVPWRQVHEALIEAANRTESIMQLPAPFVLQTGLEDFYVSYQVNAYIREANKQALVYSNLHQNIQDVCNERGIEIMSPHYRAQRDGSTSTIPASYLAKDLNNDPLNVKS